MRKTLISLAVFFVGIALPAAQTAYYPPAGEWARKTPAELGMDAARLNEAVEFMRANETQSPRRDFSDQEIVNGKLLASMPTERAGSNGLVIRRGYIVAEWGETARPDPTYSVAKSMLATVAGIALDRGLIPSVDDPVAKVVKDGGYDTPQNSRVTWRHHLQQESEWEGELWGKNANFIGREAFGRAERKPRAIQAPGAFYEYNDVRMNRFALSLLRVFRKQIPDVFRDEVMNPIGASSTWKWVPYTNAYVDIDGKRMASVAGGTRWGGGMWINSYDMARFGLLWLRNGKWGDRQIVSPGYVKMATTPSRHGPDYGFLWWLNTKQGLWPGSPTDAYRAVGQGGNIIFISPSHDLVVVWRWSAQAGEGFRRVVAAITS
ncbi:MAG: class C beta-lactamase-related serine hydrolase [Acidobacteria bacterium]|nr:MAG: class C beta-lactamase-related serine hydrolase [Acidobacteriota bacterium]